MTPFLSNISYCQSDSSALPQSRGLSSSAADESILHQCGSSPLQEAVLHMCRLENTFVCVRMSFLAGSLGLPLLQLKSFLTKNSEKQQPSDDHFVWLARDVTVASAQAAISSVFTLWKDIVTTASAAKTVCCLWRQQWRLLWQKTGMTTQLHGVARLSSSHTSVADTQAACDFEKTFLDWAQASCRSLWHPAVGYGACLKMVELGLESVCCLMEAPMLQKIVYGRIGGEHLLEVVCPHRRHLKILQLWMQVPMRAQCASPS
jgi:hypothetical protein